MKIISGNSNFKLAKEITEKINATLVKAVINKFSDGEIYINLDDEVQGQDIYIIQSTSKPASDNIMELLFIIDAVRREGAKKITVVIPYYGYSRQDRRNESKQPISSKVVANMITNSGAQEIITIDIHAQQILGFFDIPITNLLPHKTFCDHIKRYYPSEIIIVSPDIGGVIRARGFAEQLNCELVITDKRREKAGVSEVINIIGNVKNKFCIIIDDIIDSAGTICNCADVLKQKGAKKVICYATHGVLSGKAFVKIKNSSLQKVYITDSIYIDKNILSQNKIEVISASNLIASALMKIK